MKKLSQRKNKSSNINNTDKNMGAADADKEDVIKEHIKHFSAQEQFQLSEQMSGDMVNLEVFNYFSDASVKSTFCEKYLALKALPLS